LSGGEVASLQVTRSAPADRFLPDTHVIDLKGNKLTFEQLRGKPVLVEFWATWCPPCRGTLRWLGDLKARHGDRLEVVAIAVESDSADVRKVADQLGSRVRWVIGTPALARSFGDVSGVPTLHLFGPRGQGAGLFFGVPPSLHGDVEARVTTLLSGG
jgi:thiol-disulfide isomerase/thioredoxin